MDPDPLRDRRRWYETHRIELQVVVWPWWRRAISAIVDLVPRRREHRGAPQPGQPPPNGGLAGVREPRRPRPTAPSAGAAPLPPDGDRDS